MDLDACRALFRDVGWTEEDADALRWLAPHAAPHTAEIAQAFCERTRATPDASAVFSDEAQVRRFQQTLQAWVLSLLRGPHDQSYLDQRNFIGEVHAGIGLPQRFLIVSLIKVRLHLERICGDAFELDRPRELCVRSALAKLLDVELALLLEAHGGEAREVQRQAREAERLASVGTLTAGLAHEIRNPLNAASLHVTLLERSLASMPGANATAKEAAVVLREELRRLASLLNEFLEFARPRPLQLSTVGLGALLRSVTEFLRPNAQAAHVVLDCEPASPEAWAQADEERLRQVFLNLVHNAIEAAASRVVVRVQRAGAWAKVEVEDDGPGVPKEAPIFDAFFTTKPQGTGLGLSIVHRIVDDHGGEVRVQSVPGETVFTVRLPATLA